jgi:hypothetical protein
VNPHFPDSNTPTQILYQTVYKTNWVIPVCILGTGLSITAFLLGAKWALAIAVGCLGSLGLSLATVRYAGWLAGASVVLAVALCLWVVLTRRKALIEIVRGVQVFKDNYNRTGTLNALEVELTKQTHSTQKIVKEIKNKLYPEQKEKL